MTLKRSSTQTARDWRLALRTTDWSARLEGARRGRRVAVHAWFTATAFALCLAAPSVRAQESASQRQPGADFLAQATQTSPAPLAVGLIRGIVRASDTKEPLPGANVRLTGVKLGAATDDAGRFTISRVPVGTYELQVNLTGHVALKQSITVAENQTLELELALKPEPIQLSTVEVIGEVKSVYAKIPGSGAVLGTSVIEKANPIGVEVLRKVSGVNVRDEDGLGLRPNIGVRGIIPTRSAKVLLLEDGVFVVQSPYGDSQTYYHPQVSRMARVEVLKGSGEIIYGPQTMGGVINYVTPTPTAQAATKVRVMGGSREFLQGDASYSKMLTNAFGIMGNYTHLESKLTRENTHANINDIGTKLVFNTSDVSRLTLKGQFFREITNQTYAHLTQVEFEENPFGNPFVHDTLFVHRVAVHAIYEHELGNRGALATNLYWYTFHRDWWRQGNNGGANATAPPDVPGTRTILDPNRTDGKVRKFWVMGAEPRVRLSRNYFSKNHELDFGVRTHYEIQDRKQVRGDSPVARDGVYLENQYRTTFALAAFIHDRIELGEKWRVSAGLRLEDVFHHNEYRPTVNQVIATEGGARLTTLIPGFGATYHPTNQLTFFGGVHRGYGPPQVQDLINAQGGSTELPAEKSWNYELGMRTNSIHGMDLQLTGFYMDFQNQIIPQSGAGGSGTQYTTARSSAHGGLEVSGAIRVDELTGVRTGFTLDAAYTWLPIAKFNADQPSSWGSSTNYINVKGNRLTYAPEYMLTAGVRYTARKFGARLESVSLGDQFADDLNTVQGSYNGRQGLLPATTLFNADAYFDVTPWLTLQVSGKNLQDKVHIQDRSRGILVGPSRYLYAGFQTKI